MDEMTKDKVAIAKYSTHTVVPVGRPIERKDVQDFIAKNAPKKKVKKNKETKNEECKKD